MVMGVFLLLDCVLVMVLVLVSGAVVVVVLGGGDGVSRVESSIGSGESDLA